MKTAIPAGLIVAVAVLFIGGGTGVPAAHAQVAESHCGNQFVEVPDRGSTFDFGDACQLHDVCYGDGGTEADRRACDDQFLASMNASCDAQWPRHFLRRASCYSVAYTYYLGVRLGGWAFFDYGPPRQATASVTAPEDYAGTCPVDRVFTGIVTVDRIGAGATVQYRWAGPDYQGPAETLTFAQGDALTRDVSHTAEATSSGDVQRWIEILSPGAAVSNTAEVQVECQPLRVQILRVDMNADFSTCGTPGQGPAITVSAPITVNGPAVVQYMWNFNNGEIVVPGQFETTGPDTVRVSHGLPSSTMTANAMRASLTITSHTAVGWVVDFERPCPTT